MADMRGALRRQKRVLRCQHEEDISQEDEQGFNPFRDHADSDDGADYHDDTNATQLASNAENTPHATATHDHTQRPYIYRVGRKYTRYNWDQANDEAIREGFENVLKDRFADIMSDYRTELAKKARVAGFDFPDDRLDFEAMRKFPPRFVHSDIWEELCMERALGQPPTFRELFLATHLTKESKKNFWDGLYDESLDGAEFCTARSRKAYEAYERSMLEKYGEDVTLHPVGDADLWERAQGRRGFGIGSSDPHFIVYGTPSSSSGSGSYADYQRSQEQVKNLQAQVDMLQNRVEEAQQQVREEMKEEVQRQIIELLKKFGNPGNPL
ncbi:hypothetical protein HanRHA438_Chr13g0624411 [Helianthus annuus]|nr:hypothetical protein HanRHA438_Chr13g0624411 [Helianthus annuus]